VPQASSTYDWGMYPMVPYAGRVRDATFDFDGRTHSLPVVTDGHAMHGTVLHRSWTCASSDATHAQLTVGLGDDWPFRGSCTHRITLFPDRLRCDLTVDAEEPMPVQVGWHPWFVRPCTLDASFREMYVRDADGIPTGARVAPTPGPHDDCFTGALAAPVVRWDDLALRVESDCSHWVVYDEPAHALCVEPQSGPPDGFTIEPLVLAPRTTMRRTMRLVVLRDGASRRDGAPGHAAEGRG